MKQHSYVVFGRPNCVWCDRAKNLLDYYFCVYSYFNVEDEKEMFRHYFPTTRSVPQILMVTNTDHKVIGGFKELEEWLKHYTVKS